MTTLTKMRLHILRRFVSCRHVSSSSSIGDIYHNGSLKCQDVVEHKSLMIEEFGEPKDKLIYKKRPLNEVLPESLGSQQIFMEHIAALVNPADINLVQGVYGIKPRLPFIPGNEGIVRIQAVGSGVSHLKPGDLAIGMYNSHWQNFSVGEGENFFRIRNDLSVEAAVQIKVNPCTAYRMIKDFASLKEGDTIIQNGANSAVGIYAIQLAKLWGFKTINVIRNRTNKDKLIADLKNLGADVVVTEEEVGQVDVMKPVLSKLGKPKLLLDCVGGKNAMNCHRLLDDRGYDIQYGLMSKQPTTFSASSRIFKDRKILGFWVSKWYEARKSPDRRQEIVAMLDEISDLFASGQLKPKALTKITFEEKERAFEKSDTKFAFSINE